MGASPPAQTRETAPSPRRELVVGQCVSPSPRKRGEEGYSPKLESLARYTSPATCGSTSRASLAMNSSVSCPSFGNGQMITS